LAAEQSTEVAVEHEQQPAPAPVGEPVQRAARIGEREVRRCVSDHRSTATAPSLTAKPAGFAPGSTANHWASISAPTRPGSLGIGRPNRPPPDASSATPALATTSVSSAQPGMPAKSSANGSG